MNARIRMTGTHIAIDSNEATHRIFEYTEDIDVTSLGDRIRQWAPNRRNFKLSNGDHVNLLEDGRFEVARTGVLLTKIKPK